MVPSFDDDDIEHDPNSGTYRTHFDPSSGSPSVRMLDAIGTIRDEDPIDLPPLDAYVDPDALDAVFEPIRDAPDAHGSVTFEYDGTVVVVHSDGRIEFEAEP